MKASEWAKSFNSPADGVMPFGSFIGEIGEIGKARGGSAAAIEGAVKEQRSKWLAVCRLVPTLAPTMFDSLLQEHGEGFLNAARAYEKQAVRVKQSPAGKNGRGKQRRQLARR